jgi:putative ubiquitin-RnfH superfamily antitoxin RatB of RatAB toxin-antitoxin module
LLALDRVEIYRSLTIDPKQARLKRAGRMKENKLAEKNQPKASVKD